MSWRLAPNHWRYRYAAKMTRFWPIIGFLVLAAAVAAFFCDQPSVIIAAFVLSWPLILPAAGLGCYSCNYNIFLPYRGPGFAEHGDSWTHPEVEGRLWRKHLEVPNNCPKCGVAILTDNIPEQVNNA